MAANNRAVKWMVLGVVTLVLIPVVGFLGLMAIGAATGEDIVSQMGRMLGGNERLAVISGLGLLWLTLVAAALVFLIVYLVRGTTRA
jgi:hypothetical protein